MFQMDRRRADLPNFRADLIATLTTNELTQYFNYTQISLIFDKFRKKTNEDELSRKNEWDKQNSSWSSWQKGWKVSSTMLPFDTTQHQHAQTRTRHVQYQTLALGTMHITTKSCNNIERVLNPWMDAPTAEY